MSSTTSSSRSTIWSSRRPSTRRRSGGSSTITAPTTPASRTPTTGGEFGGLSPQPVASRGEGVLALIRTDDADAALASVVEAGGRVRAAIHDYPGGRRFTFSDPSGNVLGVYEPSE